MHDERKFRKSLGSLFKFDQGRIQPFHKSMVEWLTNEDKDDDYFISVAEGHKILAEEGWKRYKNGVSSWTPYLITYLPTHLCIAGRHKELAEVLSRANLKLPASPPGAHAEGRRQGGPHRER